MCPNSLVVLYLDPVAMKWYTEFYGFRVLGLVFRCYAAAVLGIHENEDHTFNIDYIILQPYEYEYKQQE